VSFLFQLNIDLLLTQNIPFSVEKNCHILVKTTSTITPQSFKELQISTMTMTSKQFEQRKQKLFYQQSILSHKTAQAITINILNKITQAIPMKPMIK
jgi:hypothetical protein